MPRTGAGSVASGYVASGVTTIRWGTEDIFGIYTVTRFNQKPLSENIKLPQGAGLTGTRIQLLDGSQFEMTVRDDTRMSPPRPGTTIVLQDVAGMIGNVGATYTCRIVDAGYDIAPKQAGERTITAERLLLVD